MSPLTLRLPESLHRRLADVAKAEGISINQLINSAVAEKMAALLTESYLKDRAQRASKASFQAALREIPAATPEPLDQIG